MCNAMAIKERKEKHFTWIDIVQPTREELNAIGEKYKLHHSSLKDSLDPDHLPKYEKIEDTVFIIMRMYETGAGLSADTIQDLTTKIAIFTGKDFVITIHKLELECLGRACEDALLSPASRMFDFLCNVLQQVLSSYEKPAIRLTEMLDKHESRMILKSRLPDILPELYQVKRQVAVLKRVLDLSRHILDKISGHIVDHTQQDYQLQDVRDHYARIENLYFSLNESANNLVNLYINLSSQRTNEVMRILTVFSVFFMPLTFIVGIYGMNFKHMPELDWVIGYPAVLGFMAIITVVIFFWFRRKGWL
jgi:magnesium transporter